jgi:hypothetical protein
MPVRGILSAFAKHGGEPGVLAGVLYQIADPVVPPRQVTRSELAVLTRCRKALSRLLGLNIPGFIEGQPTFLRASANDAAQAIDRTLALLRRKRGRGRPQAPSGVSTPSLVVALLEREFRRLYGAPCYAQIATLVQSVAPDIFPPHYATPKHLRERVRSLPDGAVNEWSPPGVRAFLDLNSPGKGGAARGRKNRS